MVIVGSEKETSRCEAASEQQREAKHLNFMIRIKVPEKSDPCVRCRTEERSTQNTICLLG